MRTSTLRSLKAKTMLMPEDMTDEELENVLRKPLDGSQLTLPEYGEYKREQNRRNKDEVTYSEQKLERSRRLARERTKLDAKTDNGLWNAIIRLQHKDGVLYRTGCVERRKAGDLFQVYATWDYGEKDEDIDIQFSRKLPAYVKEICVELGYRMHKQTPFTGVDFRDPDYDLTQYDNPATQATHTEPLSLRDEQRGPAPAREYGRSEQLRKLVE